MSLWDGFTNYFKGLVGGVASVASIPGKTAVSTGAGITNMAISSVVNNPSSPIALNQAAQGALQKALPNAKVGSGSSTDLILLPAKPIGTAFSYGINRPVSTLGLLADPSSQLYKDGEHGKGFQLSDVLDAWNRSAKVSPMQSVTAAGIHTHTAGISEAILKMGGVDTNKINLWDDKNIQENFVDNGAGRWLTGVGDLVLSTADSGLVFGALSKLGTAAKVAAGLSNKIEDVNDLAKLDTLADSHITHIETNGAMGTRTNFGQLIEDLSKTKDPNYIFPEIKKLSNNENLAPLIAESSNPAIIKDLILADKGYVPAYERLAQSAPDDLYAVGDTAAYMAGRSAASDTLPTIEKGSDAFWRAHDAAIARDEWHKKIYDTFMGDSGESLRSLGNSYRPIDPNFGGELLARAGSRARTLKAASSARDFSNVGGVTQVLVGGGLGRPVTALIHFTSNKMPRGLVTFGGVRAWEGSDEFRSMLDSIPALRSNKEVTLAFEESRKIPASEYKTMWLTKFMDAKTPLERKQVLEDFDNSFGHDLAASHGVYNQKLVDDFVKQAQSELKKVHIGLSTEGYALDHTGTKMVVSPLTQRQLLDAYAFLPWHQISRSLERAVVGKKIGIAKTASKDFAENVFQNFNHAMSASYLLRPGYIGKNSIIEPMVSATLSHGMGNIIDNAPSFIKNATFNNWNRIKSVSAKLVDRSVMKQLDKEVNEKLNLLGKAIMERDQALAEQERLLSGDVSPATRNVHQAAVVDNLRATERAVKETEAYVNRTAGKYGVVEQFKETTSVPSQYGLMKRIENIEKIQRESNVFDASIIKTILGNIKHTYKTGTIPGFAENQQQIEKAYKALDQAVADLAPAQKALYEKLSERQALEERQYGTGKDATIRVGDKDMNFAQFDDPNYFGSSLRNETSNSNTIEMSLMNRRSFSARQKMLMRLSPDGVVSVDNPLYFDELAWVANRHVRGDELQKLVLSGASRQEMYEWALTPVGKNWMKQFPDVLDDGLQGVKNFIDDRANFVERYFPDPAVRKLINEREVTSADLGKVLSDKLGQLSPIHPHEVDYPSAVMGRKKFQEFYENSLNAGFKALAAPENAIRWAWARKEFATNVERKANILHQQGVEVTSEVLNDLRQAAGREMVNELEKTFYTVRRNNKALYTARYVSAFPQAAASGIYRYGRLAVKNPARVTGFLKNYYNFYNTFGVDQNGNPVDDPSQATYIVIPGTKEMGVGGEHGVMVNSKAFGFLANTPGPSWLITLANNKLLGNKPNAEEVFAHVMDNTVGHIPGFNYNTWFPQGAQPATFVPTWAHNLRIAAQGSDSDKDFHDTFKVVHNYNMTLVEMGMLKKAPTLKEEMNQTRQMYLNKFIWGFASPIGMTPKQDVPGSLFNNFASSLLQKYNGDKAKAEQEMHATMGPKFPTDRYLYRGSTRETYVPSTIDAYNRVWSDNKGLVKKLAKQDVGLIGLLAADITGSPDAVVSKFLSNPDTTLPDGTKLNAKPLTVEEYESNLQVNRTWNMYSDTKNQLLAEAKRRGYNSLAGWKEGSAAFSKYVDQLSVYNKDWGIEYNGGSKANNSFKYAQGLNDIVNDFTFMAKNGKTDFWSQAKMFTQYRDAAVKAYDNAPTGSKNLILARWLKYINEDTANQWNPQLQQIIDRYFVNDKLTGVIK